MDVRALSGLFAFVVECFRLFERGRVDFDNCTQFRSFEIDFFDARDISLAVEFTPVNIG